MLVVAIDFTRERPKTSVSGDVCDHRIIQRGDNSMPAAFVEVTTQKYI